MTDGLSELANARAKATELGRSRRVPPAKHPSRPAAPAAKSEQPTISAEPAMVDAEAQQPTRSTTPPRSAAKPATTTELMRQTVYLDDTADDFLETIRAASRKRRVDANRSAVIRLALRHLAAELEPRQVVDEIETASRAAGTQRPGRRLV